MTRAQRKEIDTICQDIEDLKLRLVDIGEVEREKYDNLPGSLQTNNQNLEDGANILDELVDSLDEVIDELNILIGG